jgi:hypothetical protein
MNMLKRIHAELGECWKFLRGCEQNLDVFENKLVEMERRPTPRGRETPFFLQQRFSFRPLDFEVQQAPLVQSSGRTTRVVRLTATVSFQDSRNNFTNGNGPVPLRPTQSGLCWDNADASFPFVNTELFDFEWTYKMGSTQRSYTNGIGITGRNSRTSLGSSENQKSLLLNEKYPLVLKTNEFLTFELKPLMYNMDPLRNYSEDDRFFVDVTGVGYRVFDG